MESTLCLEVAYDAENAREAAYFAFCDGEWSYFGIVATAEEFIGVGCVVEDTFDHDALLTIDDVGVAEIDPSVGYDSFASDEVSALEGGHHGVALDADEEVGASLGKFRDEIFGAIGEADTGLVDTIEASEGCQWDEREGICHDIFLTVVFSSGTYGGANHWTCAEEKPFSGDSVNAREHGEVVCRDISLTSEDEGETSEVEVETIHDLILVARNLVLEKEVDCLAETVVDFVSERCLLRLLHDDERFCEILFTK